MVRLFALFLLAAFASQAQEINISWQSPISQGEAHMLWFDSASPGVQEALVPSYCGQLYAEGEAIPMLNALKVDVLTETEARLLSNKSYGESFKLDHSFNQSGILTYCLLPIRKNPVTGDLEKLIAFEIELEYTGSQENSYRNKTTSRVSSSVLSSGQWYKLGVTQSGVYKITPQFLADCGFSTSNLSSADIRVFGNGRGMLSEKRNRERV